MKIEKISTGIDHLDELLYGGFIPGRSYLIRGGPGTGKTTLCLHFLSCVANSENTLFISLSEHEQKIRQIAQIQGFNIEKINILDLSPTSELFSQNETYDIFSPSEVERKPITQKIIKAVENIKPTRVVIDSLTQFRYLSPDIFQFHQQSLSFLRFLLKDGATVLFTSENIHDIQDEDLQFMSDGILNLQYDIKKGRTITITKFRGSNFISGSHNLRLTDRGMDIYYSVPPIENPILPPSDVLKTGIPELDNMLGGGIERGTITMILGPTGVGKTTIGLNIITEHAMRRERSVLYSFEEYVEIILRHADGLSLPTRSIITNENLKIEKIEPLRFTSTEFAQKVRHEVERYNSRLIVIDSTAGYSLCIRGEDIRSNIYSLSKYLQSVGVNLLLISEVSSNSNDDRITNSDISAIADNVIILDYYQENNKIQKYICVLKKKLSDFDKTLHKFEITNQGIKIGGPISPDSNFKPRFLF